MRKRAMWAVRRRLQKLFGIDERSMFPVVGKGRYVSVYRRWGGLIDVVDERDGAFIRLVPYQPNHGVMVEFWRNGVIEWRQHVDYQALVAIGPRASETDKAGPND
jgi:hypothetical protein